jgi:hypothetical protein
VKAWSTNVVVVVLSLSDSNIPTNVMMTKQRSFMKYFIYVIIHDYMGRYEPRHDKTNIMLRNPITSRETDSKQHGS